MALFHHLDVDYKIEHKEGKAWVLPPSEMPSIDIKLSITEWISLQAHFPFLADCHKQTFHQTLKDKLHEVEQENSSRDLFEAKNGVKEHLKQLFKDGYGGLNTRVLRWMGTIQQAILEKKTLTVKREDSKTTQTIYPHQIAYLVGNLNLVAEDLWDKCLTNLKIETISDLEVSDETHEPIYLGHEVQEFIKSLRDFNDNSLRVVLKISRPDAIPKNMPFQNFINPYIVTGGGGEIIWAATLEPNEQILSWIHKHNDAIQIMDPDDFKTAFVKYCELLSTQKAS